MDLIQYKGIQNSFSTLHKERTPKITDSYLIDLFDDLKVERNFPNYKAIPEELDDLTFNELYNLSNLPSKEHKVAELMVVLVRLDSDVILNMIPKVFCKDSLCHRRRVESMKDQDYMMSVEECEYNFYKRGPLASLISMEAFCEINGIDSYFQVNQLMQAIKIQACEDFKGKFLCYGNF